MKKDIVISLFDYTGNMVKPWVENGYTAYIVDILHPREEDKQNNFDFEQDDQNIDLRIVKVYHDLIKPWECPVDKERIAFVSAFPPCDHLAISGAAWWKGKGLRKLAWSINLFATAAEFCEWSEAPYMIENPVSTISTYWRKPDYNFHPYYFTAYEKRDNYTKKTCVWAGNGFKMPVPWMLDNISEPDQRILMAPDSSGRKAFRNATPNGFAKAVYEENKIKD